MKNNLGPVTCARYAFAPNFYHYCGPETEGEFKHYVNKSIVDEKLLDYLTGFETLYPYLVSIAAANGVKDVFDPRVVDAYWVGNLLLNKVRPQEIYQALDVGQNLKKRLDNKGIQWLYPKIDQRAKLHHSFHVFNIFTRTGHRTVAHTVETMDQCRIGWGKVLSDKSKVQSQRLEYKEGKLLLVPALRSVINPIDNLNLNLGDWVSFHWGYVCEKITTTQVKRLKYLTNYHLALANQTL